MRGDGDDPIGGVVLGTAGLFWTGCTNPAKRGRGSRGDRVGRDAQGDALFLRRCARPCAAGRRQERLTYVRGSTYTHVETDYDDTFIGGCRLFRPRTTVHRQNFQCEATFTLHDGVVEQLDYAQGRDLELCGTIVETCVAVIPAPR